MDKHINRIIVILIVLAVAKSVLFAIIVPKWEIPDEKRYYKNIELIADGEVPYFQDKSETGHPVLYEALMVPFFMVGNFLNTEAVFTLIRFAGIAFFALAIYLTFLVSKEVFPRNYFVQITAPMLMALIPQLGFITGSINSDSLLIMIFSALMYFLVKTRNQLDAKSALYIIALLVAGMLTKERFIVALPIVLGVFAYKGYLFFRTNQKELVQTTKQNFEPSKLVVTIPMLSISSILVLLIFFRVTNILNNYIKHAYAAMPRGEFEFYTFASKMLKNFWANFGSLQIPLPRQLYGVLAIFSLLTIIGIGLYIFKAVRNNTIRSQPLYGLSILATAIIFTLILILIYEWRTGASQGKYLFIAVLPITIFMANGLGQIIQRFGKHTLALVFLGLFSLNIYSLFLQVLPFYH